MRPMCWDLVSMMRDQRASLRGTVVEEKKMLAHATKDVSYLYSRCKPCSASLESGYTRTPRLTPPS